MIILTIMYILYIVCYFITLGSFFQIMYEEEEMFDKPMKDWTIYEISHCCTDIFIILVISIGWPAWWIYTVYKMFYGRKGHFWPF